MGENTPPRPKHPPFKIAENEPEKREPPGKNKDEQGTEKRQAISFSMES